MFGAKMLKRRDSQGQDIRSGDTQGWDIQSRDTWGRDIWSRDAQHRSRASDIPADAPTGTVFGNRTAAAKPRRAFPLRHRAEPGAASWREQWGKAWHGVEPRHAAGSGRGGKEPSS